MVNQAQVDRLTRELEDVRGSVVRRVPGLSRRVSALLGETRRLHSEAVGTDYEPALRSVANLLTCVQRGMATQHDLQRLAG